MSTGIDFSEPAGYTPPNVPSEWKSNLRLITGIALVVIGLGMDIALRTVIHVAWPHFTLRVLASLGISVTILGGIALIYSHVDDRSTRQELGI